MMENTNNISHKFWTLITVVLSQMGWIFILQGILMKQFLLSFDNSKKACKTKQVRNFIISKSTPIDVFSHHL